MNGNLGGLLMEAKLEVIDYVDSLFPVWHTDELVVNMVGTENDMVLCVVTKKDTDEHLWLVYLSYDFNKVVYYHKQEKEEQNGD